MSDLGRFQDVFAEAIAGRSEGLAPWIGDGAERRLAVYRNTVAKGCADALAAQFPTVERVVGEAWMREAAVRFAAEEPPSVPSLADYGGGFADWLAGFPPAAQMPFLPGLARIDWAHREALFAPDHPPLGADALADLDYAQARLDLHPAARLLWFHDSTPALWSALQGDTAPAAVELAAEPQGLLLVRPHLEVSHLILGTGGFAFVDACRSGLPLAEAGAAALAAEPGLALAELFAHLIESGTFAACHRTPASRVS